MKAHRQRGLVLASAVASLNIALVQGAAAQGAPAQNVPPPEVPATSAPTQAAPAPSTPLREAPALATPAPEPPRGAPAASPTETKLEQKLGIRVYGIVKPTVIVANGVESFGAPNYVAGTAAANPLFLANPDAAAVSFQVQQTRFGLIVGEGSPLKALAEIDFVDTSKSSPAQSAIPRLRQVALEWAIQPNHKLTLGQLWDIFSPLNTHTYELVGALFQSGNSGFMRHQIIYTGTFGRFEGALALGLTNQNLQSALGNIEYGRMPTIAARAGYRMDKALWLGVAAMIARVSFDATLPTERTRIAFGGNAFADVTLGELSLRAELYAGQNLNNLGMLVLSHGSATTDVSDAGGYVSAKYAFSTSHALHLVAGAAFVLNPSELSLGYQPAAPAMGTTPARAAARLGGNGPGIERNATLRGGYAYSPYKGFSLVLEPFAMFTKHKLDAAAAVLHDPERVAWGVQFGGLYMF